MNPPRIKVMKFGGTSVGSAEARVQAVNRVINAREQGYSPVVVVSAIGRKGAPYATDTLIQSLREIDPTLKPDPRELDLLMACGEILSAVIFTHTLRSHGHAAMSFRGGQAGIRTDGVFGNARIVSIKPTSLLKAIHAGAIPVICGFQGVFSHDGEPGGELTTLGRGGSDTTASAIAAALGAECVEIYTDVDGVKSADPDYVPTAPTLAAVSYEEVAEIAHLGAKVLHPRAAEIAMRYQIPLWVKNTFGTAPGTVVMSSDQVHRRITGVTHSGKLVYLEFNFSAVPEEHRTALQSRVYHMMARYGLNLFMTNVSPSSIGFAVPRGQYAMAEDLLDGLVAPVGSPASIYMLQIGQSPSREAEIQAELLTGLGDVVRIPLALTENCTMVSLVGYDLLQSPGTCYEALAVLEAAKIPVLQTSDSEFSLSLLIPETEVDQAVSLLHQHFALERLR